MSIEYPSLKMPLLGLTVCAVPFLWFFEWAIWALIVVGLFLAPTISNWLSEAMTIYRARRANGGAPYSKPESHRPGESRVAPAVTTALEERFFDLRMGNHRQTTEDDEVRELQRGFETLWNGEKGIEFTYRSMGRGSFLSIQATVTEVIAPEFGEDEYTYFKGSTTTGEHRYFCLRYVKGRKVTDPETGETGTLRKVLGVKRRVYR